jgi:glycolate oxidase subunit GlcD
MVNAQLSRAAAPFGLHYVPDPSSQASCTIGGNLAENAGGIHCLKYGTTVDHVLAARVVLSGGEVVDLDLRNPGYDLLGVFVGSEGTFGIATEATVRLAPIPPAVRTLLAIFDDVNDASRAVSAIIAAGLMPAALEMMDGAIIRAVEASVFAAGLPLDAEAALLIELDGLEAGLEENVAHAEKICLDNRARHVRCARDEPERKKLWAARKGAFGAMGRISPDTMLQDAVVPRSRLPEVLAATYQIGAKYGLRVANVFHAGDGNLHPFLCFDARHPEEVVRVKEAGRELMETCVRAGGSITGEHGVGIDKSAFLPLIFSDNDMDTMLRVRAAFDPSGLCNPGKIIPTSRSCGEARAGRRASTEASLAAQPSPGTQVSLGAQASLPASVRKHAEVALDTTSNLLDFDRAHRLLGTIVSNENVKQIDNSIEVAPATMDEASAVLRLISDNGWKAVPSGAATWLSVGNRFRRPAVIISTRRMQRIVEHEPADLIATAEAGVTLSVLNAELGRQGQWLPLDPPDDGRATIGGVVATGMSGAQCYGYGWTRGSVIGMKMLLADGSLVKAGGRVVKNVAGYDLCKLFTGSYGTLGLILELTFKLRPRPSHTATVAASGPLDSLWRGAKSVLDARLLPVAVEMLSHGAARSIGVSDADTVPSLLIRYAGTRETVAFQTDATIKLLREVDAIATSSTSDDENHWSSLAALPLARENRLVWRAVMRPSELLGFLHQAMNSFDSSWHAGIGDGRVRMLSSTIENVTTCITSLEGLRAQVRSTGGSLAIEQAPAEIADAIDAWGEIGPSASLMHRVKHQLDPNDVFSPGR